MDASVIVHLEGGAEAALRCFQALAKLPPDPEHEVVVVDDGSADLAELLERLGGDVAVVRSERRVGFAAAAALGAERARGEVLALLQGAPEVGDDWLAPLVAALADPGVGAAASVPASDPDAHPVAARALALRRADRGALAAAAAAPEGLELAALCVELASGGRRVARVPASGLRAPRSPAARRGPGEKPELSIVIPTLDATAARVQRCVARVQDTTEAPYEIVLIDNGAPPQGFTAPVNAGVRAARGRCVVVMNDDVETLPGWWQPLRAALDAGASVAFPLTVESSTPRRDFAPWCFAMSRATVERFGHAPDEFFDPAFRVWFQDTDLHRRLRLAGQSPLLVEGSRIRHGLSDTLTSDDPALRAWIDSQVARDRERFLAKHPGAVLRKTVMQRA